MQNWLHNLICQLNNKNNCCLLIQFHPYGLSKSKKLGVGTVCVSSRMRKSLESAEHSPSTEHVPCQETDTNCGLTVSSYKHGDCAKIWGHVRALNL